MCNGPSISAAQSKTDCCIHTSGIARRQHLWSAGCHQLFVPRHRRSMFGRRAFSVAGLAAWNSLPDYLRHPNVRLTLFAGTWKLSFSRFTRVNSALEALRLWAIQWLNYSARGGGSQYARARRAESRCGVPDRRQTVFEHSRHSVWLLWHLNSV